MPGNYGHAFLKKHFVAQDRVLTLDGLCAGFAVFAKIIFLSSLNNYNNLTKLIDKIANTEPKVLAKEISNLKKFYKTENIKGSLALLPGDQDILNVSIMFDIISIFSQPKMYIKQLGKHISQPNIDEILEVILPKYFGNLHKAGGLTKVGSLPLIFNGKDEVSKQFLNLLADLQSISKKDKPSRMSLIFGSMDHRIHIGYDPGLDKWVLSDINFLSKIKKTFDHAEIANALLTCLRSEGETESIAFNVSTYVASANKDKYLAQQKSLTKKYNKLFTIENAALERSPEEKTWHAKKTNQGVTYAHIAAKFGNTKILDLMSQRNPGLVTQQTVLGYTPLYLAASQNQQKSLEFLMEDISSLDYKHCADIAVGAAHSCNIEVMKQIEERGFTFSEGDLARFFEKACKVNDLVKAQFCIDYMHYKKININKPLPIGYGPGAKELPPLIIAQLARRRSIVLMLLKAGAAMPDEKGAPEIKMAMR